MKKKNIILVGFLTLILTVLIGCSPLKVGTEAVNMVQEYSYTYDNGEVLKEGKLVGKWVSKDGELFNFQKDKKLFWYEDESKKGESKAGTYSLISFNKSSIYAKHKEKDFTEDELKTPVVEFSTMDIQFNSDEPSKIPFNTTSYLVTNFEGEKMILVDLTTLDEYVLSKK